MDLNKQQLRAILKEKRAALPPDEKKERDRAILERIASSAAFQRASSLLLYAPHKGEIDLIPLIKKIKVTATPEHPNRIHISAVLSASGSEYLNPEMLIAAAKRELGILSGNPAEEEYSILRTHVYLADGVTEFR